MKDKLSIDFSGLLKEIRIKKFKSIKPVAGFNSKYGSVHYKSEVKTLSEWAYILKIRYISILLYLKKDRSVYFLDQKMIDARNKRKIDTINAARAVIRKAIKWEDPSTSLIWGTVRKRQLVGKKFECYRYLECITDREVTATFYCDEYHLVIEPIKGHYTNALKEYDRYLYEKGFYVYRIRKPKDKEEIRGDLLSILSDYKTWTEKLGAFLGIK
jgi:very-short-patch-repair endonuclease